jgi:hypothetical protein
MVLCASLQVFALGRQSSVNLRQAHFITSSKNGGVNLLGWDKLETIVGNNSLKVKRILFG